MLGMYEKVEEKNQMGTSLERRHCVLWRGELGETNRRKSVRWSAITVNRPGLSLVIFLREHSGLSPHNFKEPGNKTESPVKQVTRS